MGLADGILLLSLADKLSSLHEAIASPAATEVKRVIPGHCPGTDS